MTTDEAVFAGIYDRHLNRVRAYCRRRVPGDAVDDLVADVFSVVWRKIKDAPQEPDTLPWLYRISHLTASNAWRAGTRDRRLANRLQADREPPVDSIEDQVVVRSEVQTALTCLDQLRPSDRELIRLSVWEGLDHQQISVVLDLKPDVLRQRLHRAKKRLTALYLKETENSKPPAAQKGGER